MRPLRHVPPGGSFFEVTTRTLQSRFLIPTGERFRQIAVGIMVRARERHPVEIYAFGGLSNHLHLLLGARDVSHLSGFMEYFNGNFAREAARIVGWKEKFWGRRFRAIEISREESALVGRLRYVISHGVKENLVLRCRDWPGLHCIDALTEGKPMSGFWHNRTAEYEAQRRGQVIDPIEPCILKLDPLPCWRHLAPERKNELVCEMVEEIDTQAARRVVLNGRAPMGASALRKQDPHTCPEHTKKSPAPAVHAASKSTREMMVRAYGIFMEAYREAATRFRAGQRDVEFPAGCFPPAGPAIPSVRSNGHGELNAIEIWRLEPSADRRR